MIKFRGRGLEAWLPENGPQTDEEYLLLEKQWKDAYEANHPGESWFDLYPTSPLLNIPAPEELKKAGKSKLDKNATEVTKTKARPKSKMI